MDTLEKDEFIKSFRNIVSQLKKKFVRRPNLVEAIESYEILGRQQVDLGFVELCAACRLSAARLEQASNINSPTSTMRSEYQLFLDAARSYSQLPDSNTTALCYEAAISNCSDVSLSWLMSMEAGETALIQEDYYSSINFFSKALQLAADTKAKSSSGEKLASAFIRQGLLMEALKVLHSLKRSQKLELTLILLSLNLSKQMNGESKSSQLTKSVLESTGNLMPMELNVAITALIDGELIEFSIPVIWQYLNVDQQQLLLSWCI